MIVFSLPLVAPRTCRSTTGLDVLRGRLPQMQNNLKTDPPHLLTWRAGNLNKTNIFGRAAVDIAEVDYRLECIVRFCSGYCTAMSASRVPPQQLPPGFLLCGISSAGKQDLDDAEGASQSNMLRCNYGIYYR